MIEEVLPVLMLDSLGLLPEPAGRLRSFISSLLLNVSIGALLVWFAVTQLHNAPEPLRYVTTELIFASKPLSLHKKLLPPLPIPESPRKIETRLPKLEPAKPEVVHMDTPAIPMIPSARPSIVVASVKPPVKTGGFGDPMGVPVNATAARPATIAAIGTFGNAPGTGQGAASPRAGLVATGGFGSGTGNFPKGTGRGTVATGGFGGNAIAAGAAPEPIIQQVHFTPPEVLSEPRPQYTQEARQLRIQGEITLQVRFGFDGKVEVLRVVSGLGHGLDQEAALVAEQIRFKPAEKNGQPTDHITYIHILFQLA
jgi:TonB family protein